MSSRTSCCSQSDNQALTFSLGTARHITLVKERRVRSLASPYLSSPLLYSQVNHTMPATRLRRERGFSLLELLIVVAIAMVTVSLAIPMISSSMTQYRLRATSVDLNSLLQRARVQAVRDDRTYNITGCPATGSCGAIGTTTSSLLLDLNGNGQYNPGEPMVQLGQGVTLTTAPASQVSAAALGFGAQPLTSVIGFTSRGTPCVGAAPCAITVGGQQVGFVFYLTSTSGQNGTALSAISVSPSGRFRSWSYDPHGGWSQ